MGDLSEHFDRSEFACRCGCGLDTPKPILILSLETLRLLGGGKPIHITGPLRCPERNRKTKGAAVNSRHQPPWVDGCDIRMDGKTPLEMKALAERISAFRSGGIGLYDDRIHVDCRDTGPARWDFRTIGKDKKR